MPAFLDSVTPVGFATNNQQMVCEAQQVDSIREQPECHNLRKSAKGSSTAQHCNRLTPLFDLDCLLSIKV